MTTPHRSMPILGSRNKGRPVRDIALPGDADSIVKARTYWAIQRDGRLNPEEQTVYNCQSVRLVYGLPGMYCNCELCTAELAEEISGRWSNLRRRYRIWAE